MSLTSQYKTDKTLEQKGVGFQFPPNKDGTVPEFFLCRMHRTNPEYQRVVERVWKPHRRAVQLNALPQAKQDDLSLTVFAEVGCVGWKHVLLSDVTGNASDTGFAEYSQENVIALCKNLPALYDTLVELATDRDNFRTAEQEADSGNSSPSSATSSSKAR